MRYVLIGNFGVGNFGDEAIKEAYLKRFPHIDFIVLSAHPQKGEYPRLPCGLRSLFSLWPRTIVALIRSDGVIFAGGSLFTDIESVFACVLWWWPAFVAGLFRKKIYFAFQGIGPFRTKIGENITRHALSMGTYVSVRDRASLKRVQKFKTTKVVQTFDPVFSLYINEKKTVSAQNVFIIIPRRNTTRAFLSEVRSRLKLPWKTVRILSLEPDDANEKKSVQSIHALCGEYNRQAEIIPVRSVDGLLHWLTDAEFVLAQRFHGALAAFAMDVELMVIPQGKNDKLSELQATATQNLSAQELTKLVEYGFTSLEAAFAQR